MLDKQKSTKEPGLSSLHLVFGQLKALTQYTFTIAAVICVNFRQAAIPSIVAALPDIEVIIAKTIEYVVVVKGLRTVDKI